MTDSTSKSADQKECSIYALIDPRTDKIRYIGQTYQITETRLRGHINASRRGVRTHVACWIRGLLLNSLRPLLVTLELVIGNGDDAEKRWIAFGYSQGWRLTNHTDGGNGNSGNKASAITKARMSIAHKQRFKDPQTRLQRSNAVKSQWTDPAIRERRLLGLRNAINSEQWVENNRQAQLTRWAKPGAKEKQSEVMKRALDSDEARAIKSKAASSVTGEVRSKALKKRYENPEARIKTGAASKSLWEDPEYRAKQSASRKASWAARKAKQSDT